MMEEEEELEEVLESENGNEDPPFNRKVVRRESPQEELEIGVMEMPLEQSREEGASEEEEGQEGIVQEKIQEQIEEVEPGSEEPIYETEEEEVDWKIMPLMIRLKSIASRVLVFDRQILSLWISHPKKLDFKLYI